MKLLRLPLLAFKLEKSQFGCGVDVLYFIYNWGQLLSN